MTPLQINNSGIYLKIGRLSEFGDSINNMNISVKFDSLAGNLQLSRNKPE